MNSARRTIQYASPSLGTVHVEFIVSSAPSPEELEQDDAQTRAEMEGAKEPEYFQKAHEFHQARPQYYRDPDDWSRSDHAFIAKAREVIPHLDLHTVVCAECLNASLREFERRPESPKNRQARLARIDRGKAISALTPEECDRLLAELVRNGLSEAVAAFIRENPRDRASMFINAFEPVAM